MRARSLSHLTNGDLLRHPGSLLNRDRATAVELLICLAEVDRRRLYVPAGYPSMYVYCLEVLHFSEDSAYKRLRAARVAREFPLILEMVADGRLHLSGVALLARHLTRESAEGLLAAAAHRSKRQIEQLLAERFPQADVPTLVRAIAPPTGGWIWPGTRLRGRWERRSMHPPRGG